MIWLFLSLLLLAAMLALASKFVLLPLLNRWIAVQEHRVQIREQQVNRPAAKRETIPLELVMAAMLWRDEWARIDTVKRMQELYDETGDWNHVRAVLSQTQH